MHLDELTKVAGGTEESVEGVNQVTVSPHKTPQWLLDAIFEEMQRYNDGNYSGGGGDSGGGFGTYQAQQAFPGSTDEGEESSALFDQLLNKLPEGVTVGGVNWPQIGHPALPDALFNSFYGDPPTVVERTSETTRYTSSTGWVVTIYADHDGDGFRVFSATQLNGTHITIDTGVVQYQPAI
jgi:hypothetical protein